MRTLVWLASFPKSGNTWVRMFVAAYLSGCESMDLEMVHEYTRSESLLVDFARAAGKDVGELTPQDIEQQRLAVQEHLARTIGQGVVKTHNARLDRRGRRLIFSRFARAAVYVVRNPLDVVDSLADHTGESLDGAIHLMNQPMHGLQATSQHASQYVGTWSHHVHSWTHNRDEFPLLVVRYEDLIADPFEQFGKLVRFLGWEFDEQRLRRAVRLTSFDSLRQAEGDTGFSETSAIARSGRFFRHGASGRWVDILSPDQVRQVIEDHGSQMQELGYDVSDIPSERPAKTPPLQDSPLDSPVDR